MTFQINQLKIKLFFKTRGLTLLEMAVIFIILGLLLSGLLIPLSSRIEQQQIQRTEQLLIEIREALLGFAILRKRLPCADTDEPSDGLGNVELISGIPTCETSGQGYLPWKELGVGQQDAWGNPFRYQTEAVFNKFPFVNMNNANNSGLRLKNRQNNYFTTTSGDSRVAAIIFSCGRNGRPDPTFPPPATIPSSDSNDADGKRNTILKCQNPKPPGGQSKTLIYDHHVPGEFDDQLIWISKYTLFQKMIQTE